MRAQHAATDATTTRRKSLIRRRFARCRLPTMPLASARPHVAPSSSRSRRAPRLRARGAGGAAPDPAAGAPSTPTCSSPDGLALGGAGPLRRGAAAARPTAWSRCWPTPTSAGTASRCPRRPPRGCARRWPACSRKPLLDDADGVHLALAPDASGRPADLGRGGRPRLADRRARPRSKRPTCFVDRVVPMSWPDDPPMRPLRRAGVGADGRRADRADLGRTPTAWPAVRLQGGLARALLPQPPARRARAGAPRPAAAAAAERWLGAPVHGDADRPQRAAAGRALAVEPAPVRPRARATAARAPLRDALAPVPRARPGARCAAAWWRWWWCRCSASTCGPGTSAARSTAKRAGDGRRCCRQPTRRCAPCSTRRCRCSARPTRCAPPPASPATADLEPMLQAAAAAWPADRPPVDNLRFEPGRLTLAGRRLEPTRRSSSSATSCARRLAGRGRRRPRSTLQPRTAPPGARLMSRRSRRRCRRALARRCGAAGRAALAPRWRRASAG